MVIIVILNDGEIWVRLAEKIDMAIGDDRRSPIAVMVRCVTRSDRGGNNWSERFAVKRVYVGDGGLDGVGRELQAHEKIGRRETGGVGLVVHLIPLNIEPPAQVKGLLVVKVPNLPFIGPA